MPIYEYRCDQCAGEFEELLASAAAAENVVCRSCGSTRVTRLLSAFSVAGSAAAEPLGSGEPGPCGACGAPRRGMCGE
jgi:putative FmdB family regulatory protein